MGIPGSIGSRHCITLIRQYMAKLAAYVAEAANLKPEAIGGYEHFIPWITAKDALCIEALHCYYLNYAAVIVKSLQLTRHCFGTLPTQRLSDTHSAHA